MSVRSDMTRKFSDSVTGLVNSGMKLAGSIIDYKAKKEQLFNSNKDVLETKYRDGIQGVLKELPESVQFDQYQQRVDSYNSDFVSKARDSGVYDEKTLSWLENEFMPSQAHRNEYAVAGVTDYAVTMWIANNANSKAQTLAADPNLSVDEASTMYKQYYDDKGLWSIQNGPNTYGYLTPDEFTEAIRETKTVQAFERDVKERFGYDPSWDTDKALSTAIAETGYKPDARQMIALRQKADSVMEQNVKTIKASVNEDTVSFTADISSYMTNGQYYDTTALDGAIASYPVAYASPLMELRISAEKSNETIVYNMVADGSLKLDDDALSCFSASSDYRAKLISDDVTRRAQSMFNSGTGIRDVSAWILNGDLGYTATKQERESIAADVLEWAKKQKQTQEQMDEIDMFYLENPQLVGDTANVSYADSPVFPDSEAQNTAPGPAAVTAPVEEVTAGNDAAEPVTVTEAGQTSAETSVDGITPKTSYQSGMGTTGAQNAAQKMQAQQAMLPSVDNQDVYNQLFYMKYVECKPNDTIRGLVKDAYRSGYLTKATAEELEKDFAFGENETWNNLIGTVKETIDKLMPDAGYQERQNAKTRIYKALVASMGANWHLLDDDAKLNSAMNMIANDVIASSWLGNAESYSKASDNPGGYLKTLTKASYGELRDAISDGSIMPFISVSAQNNYLKGNPESNGSVKDARDFFTKELGLGTSYDGLGNDLDRLFVEYNVAYAQFRGDIRTLFAETFKDYMDTGVSEMLWVDTEIGGTFAFSDSENGNLYFFPDVSTIRKVDGRLAATWFYAYDTDGDGGPDTEPVKFTDLARIVSDMSGYREKEQAKAEKNAEMAQSMGELSQSASAAASELEAEAFNKDNSFLIRSSMLGEASKQNSLLTIINAIGSFFGIGKGKYDSEDALVRETLNSIR